MSIPDPEGRTLTFFSVVQDNVNETRFVVSVLIFCSVESETVMMNLNGRNSLKIQLVLRFKWWQRR